MNQELSTQLSQYQSKIDALTQALEMRDGEKELAEIELQSLKQEAA